MRAETVFPDDLPAAGFLVTALRRVIMPEPPRIVLDARVPETSCEYWLIVHRDLRRAACVRAIATGESG